MGFGDVWRCVRREIVRVEGEAGRLCHGRRCAVASARRCLPPLLGRGRERSAEGGRWGRVDDPVPRSEAAREGEVGGCAGRCVRLKAARGGEVRVEVGGCAWR